MSIYATLWRLKFPVTMLPGDDRWTEEWVEVIAQGVPAHIGWGDGPETQDAYYFLGPRVPYRYAFRDDLLRAVVIIDEYHREKEGQRYLNPLMVLGEHDAYDLQVDFLSITDALERRYGWSNNDDS